MESLYGVLKVQEKVPEEKALRRRIIPDSSMVEHTAVNRGVVGSSPTRGVFYNSYFLGMKYNCLHIMKYIWRHSQVVRQRSATPSSPVQIWLAPLVKKLIIP